MSKEILLESLLPEEADQARLDRIKNILSFLMGTIDKFGYQELSRQILSQGNFRKLQEISYESSFNGTVKKENREILKDGDGSYVLALTDENNIVMVLQVRPGLKNPFQVELPAGGISGEKPVVNALDELAEETGGFSENITSLGSGVVLAGRSPQETHFFIARGVKIDPSKQRLESGELIIPFLLPFSDLPFFSAIIMENSDNPEYKGLGIDPKVLSTFVLAKLYLTKNVD